MKKLLAGFTLMITVLAFAGNAKAMDYMAGAKTGYYAWQPFLKDVGASGMSDIDWGTGLLYGPIFSMIISPDFSFSLAGLVGEQSTHWQSMYSDFNATHNITGTYFFEAFRTDIDSALSYRLTEKLKIFAGYKYQYLNLTYRYTELRTQVSDNVISEINVDLMDDMKSHLHGPALGMGLSFPLGLKYFFAANISGLYMRGNVKMKSRQYHADSSTSWELEERPEGSYSEKVKMQQFGLNFEPAIGMNPGEGLPVITLGFRYQRFWANFYDTGNMELPDKTLDDILIGGFVSAVFVF